MLREIKDCPVVATLRNGKLLLFNHDVTVKGVIMLELTVECIAQISAELIMQGIDVISVSIDEARMNYMEIEVL